MARMALLLSAEPGASKKGKDRGQCILASAESASVWLSPVSGKSPVWELKRCTASECENLASQEATPVAVHNGSSAASRAMLAHAASLKVGGRPWPHVQSRPFTPVHDAGLKVQGADTIKWWQSNKTVDAHDQHVTSLLTRQLFFVEKGQISWWPIGEAELPVDGGQHGGADVAAIATGG